jgi:membrane protease YdiL (CAAX protease family)
MSMDRRLVVILVVCLIEAGFRLLSGYIFVDGLIYTLLARLVEVTVILVFSYRLCGVITASLSKELAIGLGVAAAFGALVLAFDLVSRIFMEKGLLNMLLSRAPLEHWLSFFFVGCLIGPFVEELFFRGLLYAWMRESLGASVCIILTSMLFACLHGNISIIQLTGGILFASMYEWRRNIWAPLIVHTSANIGIWVIPHIHPLM